jgi:hypothetical protein
MGVVCSLVTTHFSLCTQYFDSCDCCHFVFRTCAGNLNTNVGFHISRLFETVDVLIFVEKVLSSFVLCNLHLLIMTAFTRRNNFLCDVPCTLLSTSSQFWTAVTKSMPIPLFLKIHVVVSFSCFIFQLLDDSAHRCTTTVRIK